jgi:hypothetical protein
MLPLLAGAVKRAIARTMTPCSQSQIGRCPYLRRRGSAQVEAASWLSVVVRSEPFRTAVNGTLAARPARTTMLAPSGDGSQLDGRVRPVRGDPPARGQEPEGSRQLGGETRTPARLLKWCLVAAALAL